MFSMFLRIKNSYFYLLSPKKPEKKMKIFPSLLAPSSNCSNGCTRSTGHAHQNISTTTRPAQAVQVKLNDNFSPTVKNSQNLNGKSVKFCRIVKLFRNQVHNE